MPTIWRGGCRPLPGIIVLRPAAGILGAAALAAALLAAAPAAAFSLLHSHARDPAYPRAAVIGDASGNLYGTTSSGGVSNGGTVFTIRTDGTGFSVLHSFAGGAGDGRNPWASLILDASGNLYGTTLSGGASNGGTVFTIKTDGTSFSVLHSFAGGAGDGQNPYASLILDASGNLYGTTFSGGASYGGTVFTVRTDGTGFSVLHSFAGGAGDGLKPYAALIPDASGFLYGTTELGGASNGGTVYRIKTDGTGFSVLRSFAGGAGDGQNPYASLILDASGNLYGTTVNGGAWDLGTVYSIKTDGTGFSVLHSFAVGAGDGQNPYASLMLDTSGNLFGTTRNGGASDGGTVFKIKTDGAGFSVLVSFAWYSGTGWSPQTSLILDASGNLYGTTPNGGQSISYGTLFRIETDGTGFSILYSFVPGADDGLNPNASLITDASGNLYGTTYGGGASDRGTVFTMKTDGTGFSVLHSFAGGAGDGRNPDASLILDASGNLYGTAFGGGASDGGTVFKIKTDGTGFVVLHSFAGGAGDGQSPNASLILDASGNLYGTTQSGGASIFYGTVFKVKTDGTGFSILHSFAGGAGDGQNPWASLILDASGNLYGTTRYGGAWGGGTVFRIKADGTGFSLLRSFAGGAGDGRDPGASLILDASGNLYGTTLYGGAWDRGTVFTMKTDGTGFSVLHSFLGGTGDGQDPVASLTLDASGNLYGTTPRGGAADGGTVFTIRTDGTGFSVLHSFAGGAGDGKRTKASLILDASGDLYGTTVLGGASDLGTEFTLPAPCLGAPTGGPGSRCGPGTLALSASGAGAGQDYTWYDAATGGTLLQTGGASFTTPPISTTTTFYVSVYDTTTLCESGRMAVTATVNPIPAAPTAGSEATVCQGESIHLTASTVPGATYSWTGPDGFVSAAQNPLIANAQPAASGTYNVTVTVGGCESVPGTTTTTVTADAQAPTVTAPTDVVVFQSLCCGAFGGASSDTSAALATFLSGGSAVDDCVATATGLAPQAGGSDVTGTTCFEVGTTTVTFRFSDAAGNVGSDTADLTVRMYGDLDLSGAVDPSDMVVLQSYFNFAATPEVPPFGAPEAMADLTHDTLVDPADMVQLQAYFNFAVSCLAP